MIIRNMRDLVALEAFKFAGRHLQPGDPFQAASTHARLLIAMGRATTFVAPEPVVGLPQNPYVGVPPVAPLAPAEAAPAPAEAAPQAVIEQAAEVPSPEASQAEDAPAVAPPVADAPAADAAPAAVGATEAPAAEPVAATRKRRAPASQQA